MLPPQTPIPLDGTLLEAYLRPFVPEQYLTAIRDRFLALGAVSLTTPSKPRKKLPETTKVSNVKRLNIQWPSEVDPIDLAVWLRTISPKQDGKAADMAKRIVPGSSNPNAPLTPAPAHTYQNAPEVILVANAFHIWRSLEEDRRRLAIAVDAGRTHHDLLALHRRQPKHTREIVAQPSSRHRYVIRLPESPVQLSFAINSPHGAFLEAFREWKRWHGLRVWAAILWLASKAGRTGSFVWKLDAHLAALGYSDRSRRDPHVRKRIASEVEALTQIEIEVYNADGTLRIKDAILRKGVRAEAVHGGDWMLEGAELRITPMLYHGVRQYHEDGTPGPLGSLWYPAPVELAQVDAERHPHALALGFILPIRWRWDLHVSDHLYLRGDTLLETAGIPVHDHNLQRAMETLQNNLDELVRIGGLGRYEWTDGEAWKPYSVCRLYPPSWAVDRTVHGIAPIEHHKTSSMKTGEDLFLWRQRIQITQREAAKRLGVSERTLRSAEGQPDRPLPPKILKAFERELPRIKSENNDHDEQSE